MQQYLQKRALYPALIHTPPAAGLELVVTIPCHNENDLGDTLKSLADCTLPDCAVEVLVVINASETAAEAVKKQNEKTLSEAQLLSKKLGKKGLQFHFLLFNDLHKKHAGVGLARKIAMDEAVRRFLAIEKDGFRNPQIIACCDADTLVESNYLCVLHDFFLQNEACQAAGIYYEHPTSNNTTTIDTRTSDSQRSAQHSAIIQYELHLRYYVHALRQAGLPTATQTVGSSMVVRAAAYCAQGGMNRRKAGEDFYFIHKFTGLGGFREITSTTVIPSPRISDRVPFGTGKAVGEIVGGQAFLSYNPFIFKDLEFFLSKKALFYGLDKKDLEYILKDFPPAVSGFLKAEHFVEKIHEIQSNTTNQQAFEKRFFQWFDAFLAMKYVHYAREGFYPSMAVEDAVRRWLEEVAEWTAPRTLKNELDLLILFRDKDKSFGQYLDFTANTD